MLHRRQFGDKENKIPIKEETILIKSPLRNSFLQKFAQPLQRTFSRKSSQKSVTKAEGSMPASKSKLEKLAASSMDAKPAATVDDDTSRVAVQLTKVQPVNSELNNNANNNANTTKLNNNAAFKPVVSATNNCTNTNALAKTTSVPNSAYSYPKTDARFVATLSNSAPYDRQTSYTPRQVNSNPPPVLTLVKKNKGKHENRARKALRVISFILGAFIFCFAPWHVVVIVNSFCTNCWKYTIYHHFYYSCYFLCYMNSPINPFMYALANQQFSKTFFRILKGDLRRL